MKRGDRCAAVQGQRGQSCRGGGRQANPLPLPRRHGSFLFLLPFLRRACNRKQRKKTAFGLCVFLLPKGFQAGVPPSPRTDDRSSVGSLCRAPGQRPPGSRAWVYRTKGPWGRNREHVKASHSISNKIYRGPWPVDILGTVRPLVPAPLQVTIGKSF